MPAARSWPAGSPNRCPAAVARSRTTAPAIPTGSPAYFAERARGGVGLIITGGYAPNRTGWLLPFAAQMTSPSDARRHRRITDPVHEADGAKIRSVSLKL